MNKFIAIILIISSLMISCQKQITNQDNKNNERIIKVETAVILPSTQSTTLVYSGTIEPEVTIPLTFQTIGTVKSVAVKEGDFVTENQLLATTEKESIKNAYNASVSQYKQALDAHQRLSTVYNAGSLPEIKWVEIESKLEQAEANMNIYKQTLSNCEMRAPTEGFIGKLNLEVGMSAMQMQAPIELVKLETVIANISVPENEISIFEKGQDATIHISALNQASYTGYVENIGVVANSISRTYSVKIVIDNRDLKIKPGMVCEVTLSIAGTEQQFLVPIKSINRISGNTANVFIIDLQDSIAVEKEIITGRIKKNHIVVLSGIKSGDIIITKGAHKVKNNSKVRY